MKTKLFESPLWKSAFFVYGLGLWTGVAIGFARSVKKMIRHNPIPARIP
ncbi:MAG: hypothetical protein BECKG1743E_GA0114224_100514 [Candidatus Kentron sp. G]|nr:MAG: hypothetical protein BECKG1743E_GA0114224_100514 [Candidatus Kentron sp. G]